MFLLDKFIKLLSNSKKQLESSSTNYDMKKWVLLSFSFLFIIATYSIIRPLKTSVFLGLIGKEYAPITKFITIIILFPILFIYSKLVDKFKRHEVLYYCLGFYIVSLIVTAGILLHPVIGLQNTETNAYRIFGWVFYILIDLYSTIVVSTFWAFANSISTPEYAKNNYGKIISISRIGGIITSIGSWFIMEKINVSISTSIPILVVVAAMLSALAALCIIKIKNEIPGYLLHGYEAVYKVEKQRSKDKKVSMIEGLRLMITQPYVMGIFSLVYIFEAISMILDYQMQIQMSVATNNSIGGMSSFMFLYTAAFQVLGFIIALFGTSTILKKFGVKLSLFLMPIATILMMFYLLALPNLTTIFVIMVLIRALHYGFNGPVREILYIPTSKDIKFKSKSWIDSFGRTLSKTSSSLFNYAYRNTAHLVLTRLNATIIIGLSAIWTISTFFVGKKYKETVEANKTIGE